MKATRNLHTRLLAALLAIALAACSVAGPPAPPAVDAPASLPEERPVEGQTPAGPGTQTPGEKPPATEAVVEEVARPTVAAVPALSEGAPSFPGLYWTEDLLVERRPEGVGIIAPFPCSQLFELLGSGDWQLASQAVPAVSMGLSPVLARLERGGQVALVRAEDLGVEVDLNALQEGIPPTPAAAATAGPEARIGCSATVELVSEQPVEASGAYEGSGTALAYPLLLGCTQVSENVSVNLMYEGPGSLRANLTFSVPPVEGEHPLDFDNLELNLADSEVNLIEAFAQAYAQGLQEDESGDLFEELFPMSENPGRVTVTGLDPLEGEVELQDWGTESGEAQSFRAGFRCPNIRTSAP